MKYVNIELFQLRKNVYLTKKKSVTVLCLYPPRMHYMPGSSNIEMGKTVELHLSAKKKDSYTRVCERKANSAT